MTTVSFDPGLQVRPMVHVADLAASIAFYQQLGGEIIHGGRESRWVLMQLGPIQLGLIVRPPDASRGESTVDLTLGAPGESGQSIVELTFGARMRLVELEQQLHRGGFPVAEMTTDPDFGEQLRVRTPEGLLIKIFQLEPDN